MFQCSVLDLCTSLVYCIFLTTRRTAPKGILMFIQQLNWYFCVRTSAEASYSAIQLMSLPPEQPLLSIHSFGGVALLESSEKHFQKYKNIKWTVLKAWLLILCHFSMVMWDLLSLFLKLGKFLSVGIIGYPRSKAKVEMIIQLQPCIQNNIFFKNSEMSYQKSYHPEVKLL